MKKTLFILFGFILFSCGTKTNEVKYSNSKQTTIENLKKIWESKSVIISKGELSYNGNISTNISIIVSGGVLKNSKIDEMKIEKTSELIKNSILNYEDFSDFILVRSYTIDGERRTASKTLDIIKQ